MYEDYLIWLAVYLAIGVISMGYEYIENRQYVPVVAFTVFFFWPFAILFILAIGIVRGFAWVYSKLSFNGRVK